VETILVVLQASFPLRLHRILFLLKNIRIKNIDIEALSSQYVGGISGKTEHGIVQYANIEVKVSGKKYVGGVTESTTDTTIKYISVASPLFYADSGTLGEITGKLSSTSRLNQIRFIGSILGRKGRVNFYGSPIGGKGSSCIGGLVGSSSGNIDMVMFPLTYMQTWHSQKQTTFLQQ